MIDFELLQAEVARLPYSLLFATVSGAHLYGFPSPDSDYDLRGAHILSAKESVGLLPKQETIEFSGLRDGIEMDLVTHDVLKFFTMLLKRNGYVLEQLYSPLVVRDPGASGIEGNRGRLRNPSPQPPLPGFRGDSMGSVPKGRTTANKAVAVCLSSTPDRHPSHAHRQGGGQSGGSER